MIQTSKDTSKEVTLAARAVQGLLWMNELSRRKNTAKDKVFIKALLIAACTLKNIHSLKQNELPPKCILSFIKGK